MDEFDALFGTLFGLGSIASLLLCVGIAFFIFAVIALPFYVISINGKMKELVYHNKEMSQKLSRIQSSVSSMKVKASDSEGAKEDVPAYLARD